MSAKRQGASLDDSPHASKRRHLDLEGHQSESKGDFEVWMVQWRKPQTKKHKTWDGDGVLIVREYTCELQNLDGQRMVNAKVSNLGQLQPGDSLNLAGKDIEIERYIPRDEFLSGKCFDVGGPSYQDTPSAPKTSVGRVSAPFKPLIPKVALKASTSTSSSSKAAVPSARSAHLPAEPLSDAMNVSEPTGPEAGLAGTDKIRYWAVQWRKPQARKHKSWDGDAVVSQLGTKLTLLSDRGAFLGSTTYSGGKLQSGVELFIGGKEIEVDCRVLGPPDAAPSSPAADLPTIASSSSATSKFVPPVIKPRNNSVGTKSLLMEAVASNTFYSAPKKHTQRHDPNAPGALVMPAPSKEHQKKFNTKNAEVNTVVVDPVIGKSLRPHQREGMTFMYECVMGMKMHEGQGCILADEMGLGKTIQTIALIWTLLKQNPYGKAPAAGKVLIVCPVSLLTNWRKEFHKWLGKDRVDVLVGDKDVASIKGFKFSKHHVLVIGYERLRSVIEDLAYCHPPIGLIVCDEGHRLKSADSKTTKMFDALKVPRRIILSGTPVQNNLGEFHAMANFCNPSLLESYQTFNRLYEIPILKSRAPGCSPRELEVGAARAEHLAEISKSFVLRRTADILSNYLPPKNEYVIFVRPTALQLAMFAKILTPDRLDDLIGASTVKSLALIGRLTKLCNSPVLLKNQKDETESHSATDTAIKGALSLIPQSAKMDDMSLSGKMMALQRLLKVLRQDTDEKVVIVSHWTATLDVIEKFCTRKKYTYFRLDGSTKVESRQVYVDKFNRSSQAERFLFLLSAKAGGVGLNLIGASRLILVDSDWNPSHDLQAMARIHRDGQKRPVFIYRLLTSGTIDEKIFQRAITKMGLSESLMGAGGGNGDGGKSSKGDSFSQSELRDLFTIHPTASCHTHELLGCHCAPGKADESETDRSASLGVDEDESEEEDIEDPDEEPMSQGFINASQYKPPKVKKPKKNTALVALDEWTHVNCLNNCAHEFIHDKTLLKLFNSSDAQLDSNGKQTQSVLDAIDLKNLDESENGKVAFVFERISKSDAPLPDDV